MTPDAIVKVAEMTARENMRVRDLIPENVFWQIETDCEDAIAASLTKPELAQQRVQRAYDALTKAMGA